MLHGGADEVVGFLLVEATISVLVELSEDSINGLSELIVGISHILTNNYTCSLRFSTQIPQFSHRKMKLADYYRPPQFQYLHHNILSLWLILFSLLYGLAVSIEGVLTGIYGFWSIACFLNYKRIQIFSKPQMNLFTSLLPGNTEQEEQLVKSKQKSFDFFFCLHAKDYFNIEEEAIFARIRSAIFLRPSFNVVLEDKPDLYGPFWIATTLIVVLVGASSLMHFFSNSVSAYDFDSLGVAASLIYGIAFGSPYIIAILVKVFGGMASVVDLMCIYGYSLTSFIPITAVCFIKSWLIQSILLLLAFSFSSIFLIRGIFSMGGSLGQGEKGVLAVFILGVQLLLVLMYKFYFFTG